MFCCTHDPEQHHPGSQVGQWRTRELRRLQQRHQLQTWTVLTKSREEEQVMGQRPIAKLA